MKNSKKLASFLLTGVLLTSCGNQVNDDLRLYKHKYDNGKYFETMKENKDSEKDIFVALVIAGNDSDKSIEVKASDFKLTFDKTDYTALFIVNKYQFSSITIDGKEESITYVLDNSNSQEIKANSGELMNIQLAFEAKTDGDFTISYKGTTLKQIGE